MEVARQFFFWPGYLRSSNLHPHLEVVLAIIPEVHMRGVSAHLAPGALPVVSRLLYVGVPGIVKIGSKPQWKIKLRIFG